MSANSYDTNLMAKLSGLNIGMGFGNANPNDYLNHLDKHFNEKDIIRLKELNAIPKDWKPKKD